KNLERLKLPGGGKGAPGIESRKADGPLSLKSLLPPPSRRGLILVDPSWEEKNELQTIPAALAGALRRFPQGTYIIWYPLLLMSKDTSKGTIKGAPGAEHSGTLPETLLKLFPAGRCCIEFHTAPRSREAFFPHTGTSPRGMYGSGLVVYNPPWTLKAALEDTLPYLAGVLGSGDWSLEWKQP
ncbi:MAG: 23S rRNA (adenine(2030)-N(6))-methyltransferase RlmJ, partial [Treponema sp.]|nr:23S rRNA (adenine(2030)-N(6))-methyltransferase RlmJ [Treponema sp.]